MSAVPVVPSLPTMPGAAGGAVTGQANAGLPVLAGKAGNNQFSPTAGIGKTNKPINTVPTAITGSPMSAPGGSPINTPPQPVGAPPTTGTGSGTSAAPVANDGNTLAGYTPQQTQQLQKQLNDIYGKGEGGLLFSEISNLGSNDSSYMQAYTQAMSKQTAEGTSTIDTSLGNAGISANSSTAAIETGDYLSGVTSQEGLQEQQLIQQQQQQAIGLTQGLQQASQAENSTSWLSTLAQVAGVGATLAGVSGASGSLPGLFNTAAPNPQTLQTNTGADPLGLQAPNLGSGLSMPGTTSMGMSGGIPVDI